MSDSVWHLGCGAEKCAPHNLERVVEEMHDSIYDHLGLKCLNISNGSNGRGHGIIWNRWCMPVWDGRE